MTGTGRVSSWLRLAFALVLSLGLSSAAAATAASEGLAPHSAAAALTQVHVTAAAHATGLRAGAELRHAVTKHRPAATASALVVAAIALTGVTAVSLRRRRSDVCLSHHAFSRGARAPPVVVGA